MHESDGRRNEIKTHEEEDVNLKNNDCCDCMEGYVLGENVYCSIDGRFHPLCGNLICKKFIPNNITTSTW